MFNEFQVITNAYSNPLPLDIKNKFWAFYPLIHFQSFIFKLYLQLNDYHIKVINNNPQFKILIDNLLKLDLFSKPSLNVGLFPSYENFLLPNLRYLQIGDKNNDFELLKLYRYKHIHIKDKFTYDIISENYEDFFVKNLSPYDILYFQPYIVHQNDDQKAFKTMHVLLLTIANFIKLITQDSLVIIQIMYISDFIVDVVTILQYVFEDVHLVRTIMDLTIYQTKHIICKKLNKQNLKSITSKVYNIAKDINKYSNIPTKLFVNNDNSILTKIHEQIGNERIKHIHDCAKLMDIIYDSITKNIINVERLKIIQDSEKIKAINLFSKLEIKPNYTILFSKKDVHKFLSYDKPLLICEKNISTLRSNVASYENKNNSDKNNSDQQNLLNKCKTLESELFLHKEYLNRVEWKKFKQLDKLFRLTSTLKMIIKNKHLVDKSYHLSQAYFKMIEVLNECFTKKDFHGKISAFHICEAPGQFIKSFQSYSKLQQLEYVWKAQTLLPDGKNFALDDVYGLISNNKQNWFYGKDNTGDITSHNNILEYEQLSKKYKYNIITSDCGIQFSSYEFQEEEIEFINYSQFLTMMICLQTGGHCAMKIFLPLIRPIALYMHNMLFEYFDEVIYFKPSLNLTSSEIYLVAKGYKGISNTIRDELLHIHKNFKTNNFTYDLISPLPICNLEKHYNACNQMVFNSISCINKYLFFYYYMDSEMEKKLKNLLNSESKKWINIYFQITT
jgi:hypothetical protein